MAMSIAQPVLAADGGKYACRPAGVPTESPNVSSQVRADAEMFARAFLPDFFVYPEYDLSDQPAQAGSNDSRAPRFVAASEFALHSKLVVSPGVVGDDLPEDLRDGTDEAARPLLAILAMSNGIASVKDQPGRTEKDGRFALDVDVARLEKGGPDPVVYCRMFRVFQPGELRAMWRIKYCLLLSDNVAYAADAYRFLEGKQLNHHGDWLFIEVLVVPEGEGVWSIREVAMVNHSRRIRLQLDELPVDDASSPTVTDNAVRTKLWLENRSHEPFPFSGTRGMCGAPKGVWYTSDGEDRVRDEFLTHAGTTRVYTERASIRLLDPATAAVSLQRRLLQRDDRFSPERLDEEFVARYRGTYGYGPDGADNPEGPFYGGPQWQSLVPPPGTKWRDGTKFEGNAAWAAFLDPLSDWADTFQGWIDWVEENPWGALTWYVVAPLMLAYGVLSFIVGGLSFVGETLFGDGGGGEGGDEDGPQAPVEFLPTRTAKGGGDAEGLFVRDQHIYWYSNGEESLVCEVPRLTRGKQRVGQLVWAEPGSRNTGGTPTSITFDAVIHRDEGSQAKLDTPYSSDSGETWDWWVFPDSDNRAYRPAPGDAGSGAEPIDCAGNLPVDRLRLPPNVAPSVELSWCEADRGWLMRPPDVPKWQATRLKLPANANLAGQGKPQAAEAVIGAEQQIVAVVYRTGPVGDALYRMSLSPSGVVDTRVCLPWPAGHEQPSELTGRLQLSTASDGSQWLYTIAPEAGVFGPWSDRGFPPSPTPALVAAIISPKDPHVAIATTPAVDPKPRTFNRHLLTGP